MEMTRRELLKKSGKFILLTSAAAAAWDYVLAGNAEASPNYDMTKHWWAMLIDPGKCIGCGNCVRACEMENEVPEGYFRTWIERYHVNEWDLEHPQVDSPNGGHDGFPEIYTGRRQDFLRSEAMQPLRRFALRAGLPGGRDVHQLPTASCWWIRNYCLGLPLLHPGLPVRLPLPESENQHRRQMHAMLSPHHAKA